METLEAIKTRRSIRRYKSDPVPEEKIKILLEMAMMAPSACNQQPWEFIVINDRKILDTIPTFHPYSQMLREAPLAIVVCGDPRYEVVSGFWIEDCSAAIQNLLLAAKDQGLGSVWLAVYPEAERVSKMKELLDIPGPVIPLAVIAIGYANEEKGSVDRFQPDRIHRNGW